MSNSCNPMNCSLPGSSVHGILQARILEWVAISFSRGTSDPGIKPRSPALQQMLYQLSYAGKHTTHFIAVVQLLDHVPLFTTPWTREACQASLSFTIFQSFPRLMSVEWAMLSNHTIFCCPLLLCLQSFPESFPMSWLFASGGQRKLWSLVTLVSKDTEFKETDVGGKKPGYV